MTRALTLAALLAALMLAPASKVGARGWDTGGPGLRTAVTRHPFERLVDRVRGAVRAERLGIVAQASASRGAAARGVKIPGNQVLMVFRNDYAVRMLEASVPAGIEAPLRFYVTEEPDGRGRLSYRPPTAVFRPYASPALDALATELDEIFERIFAAATGG